jgi:hypothetical protein
MHVALHESSHEAPVVKGLKPLAFAPFGLALVLIEVRTTHSLVRSVA